MRTLKFFTGLIVLLSMFDMQAQSAKNQKDSILLIIQSQNSSDKLKSIKNLVEYYSLENTDSAKYYAEELIKLSQKDKYYEYTAFSYDFLGEFFLKKGNFLQAEEYFKKAIEIQKKFNLYEDMAVSYKKLSSVNYFNNNLSKSIDYSLKSLTIYEKLKNKNGINDAISNLGTLYSASGNFKKALKLYFSIIHSKDSISEEMKIKLFHNIGSQYKRLNMPDSALFFYNKSLMISIKHNYTNEIASNYYNIGDIYASYINRKDSALFYLNKALQILGKTNLNLQKAIYASIGKTYFENNEYEKSISSLNQSLTIAEQLKNLNGKEIAHYFLYQSYKKINNYKQAFFHMEKYIEAKDSIKYEQAKVEIENLQSKHENEKNKLIIEKLEFKRHSDNKIKEMFVVVIVLLFVSFFLVTRSFILKKKKNLLQKKILEIEKEKLNQDLQHKTRELTSQSLMMLQKNKLLDEILQSLSELKITGKETNTEILNIKQRIKYSMNSENDWELFRGYFEEINNEFFPKLKKINSNITPAEMKLAALIKLGFSIKESASLLNNSVGSIKTARYHLRKKLNLSKTDNIFDFLNTLMKDIN